MLFTRKGSSKCMEYGCSTSSSRESESRYWPEAAESPAQKNPATRGSTGRRRYRIIPDTNSHSTDECFLVLKIRGNTRKGQQSGEVVCPANNDTACELNWTEITAIYHTQILKVKYGVQLRLRRTVWTTLNNKKNIRRIQYWFILPLHYQMTHR